MQPAIPLALLLAGLVFGCIPTGLLRADEPADTTPAGKADRQADSDASVARELSKLKQAVARLEGQVERLLDQPSEFSPVEVRVIDERGEPLSGFKVELSSSAQTQLAKASGISNDDGIALNRRLPYGQYQLSVSGDGWNSSSVTTVEVGQPLDLTIVGPAPDRTGELILDASLESDALERLPFGGWKTRHRDGWATLMAPEPDEVQKRSAQGWATFATVADGIEAVAVVVELRVHRSVEQTDGSQRSWRWYPSADDNQYSALRWLVQSDGLLRPLKDAEERLATIKEQGDRFGALAGRGKTVDQALEAGSRNEQLGYYVLQLGKEHREKASVRLPTGTINLSVSDLYGRPKDELLQAIDLPEEEATGEIWLRAAVAKDSQWLVRMLGAPASTAKSQTRAVYAREVKLLADKEEVVAIGAAADTDPRSRTD